MSPFGDPYPFGWPYYQRALAPQPRWYYYSKTVTTNNTTPEPVVDEERVRKIVRQEIADIMPIDVPDAPPEDLA